MSRKDLVNVCFISLKCVWKPEPNVSKPNKHKGNFHTISVWLQFNDILVQSSNRSARIMSIFQGIQNSKISENSDNKTGDYSSFKITKIYFQKKSSGNFFGQKMESTLPKYVPSISQLLIIPCIGHSKSHFLPMVLNGKKCWFVSLWVLFVLQFISDYVFIKGEGVSLPTSVGSISIQCIVDEICLTVLTTWRLIRKDP